MRWLLFLSRVAFICNLCFLIAFSLLLYDWIKNEEITNLVVLIGYVMGFVINPFMNLCYLVVFLVKKLKLKIVPSWLITANVLFLVIQILFILFLNGKQHT